VSNAAPEGTILYRVNPIRFGGLFTPIWLLLAPSLWLYWDEWMASPVSLALIGGLPVIGALAAIPLRNRWRLEFEPDALVRRTLWRTERYEWSRIDACAATKGIFGLFRSVVITGRLTGPGLNDMRALLPIFGDLSAKGLAREIDIRLKADLFD
jgi:hypothetical protein